MKKKIRLAMMGGGSRSFIGIVHRIAAYMGENYQLIGGVFDVDFDLSLKFASEKELDLSRTYPDIQTFIRKENSLPEEKRVEVVVIVTPNHLHYSMAKELLEGGFHVICEKPITTTSKEAEEIEKLVEAKKRVFALTHTYTGYPMVRQMREMISQGLIGKIQKIDAQYYQGWINPFIHVEEKRKSVWRLDPQKAGISCCMGDIGVHAYNLIEYTTGLYAEKLLADINTLYPENPLDVDGTVLLRFPEGIRGLVRASQIATGEENNIQLAIYGDKGGLKWNQEDPTRLFYLPEGLPAQIFKPGNSYNTTFAQSSTKIAPGHPEGLFDAMGNIYAGVAKAIRGEDYHEGAFPTVREGVRGMKFIEAVVSSGKANSLWINLN